MKTKMRVALSFDYELNDEDLTLAKQLGAKGIVLRLPKLEGKYMLSSGKSFHINDQAQIIRSTELPVKWEFMELLRLRTAVEDSGLKLEGIENTPKHFYDKAMLGLTGRDEQIENYKETIRNLGRAGIPFLGYHWMPNHVWRTSMTTPTRGNSKVPSFDLRLVEDAPLTHGRVISDEEMWSNYEYFIKAVIPVAQEAGVKLALHPDDPPVPSLGGVARIMRSFDAFKRAMDIVDSPSHCLDFCLGSWSSMENTDAIEVLRYFGPQGKICYCHFRDVKGTVPKFEECYLGEGNYDLFHVMRVLEEVGFDGPLLADHVPIMDHDTDYRHRAHSFAAGYISGLLYAVERF